MSVRIITDSASDITGEGTNVTVLPMTISFGDTQYLDGVELSHKEFYKMLIEGDELPTTSQISPFQFEQAFKAAQDAGESVIVITIASKLSGTYQSACIAAEEYQDTVFVIDSENACIGEGVLVKRAEELARSGIEAKEIAELLNSEKKKISIIALLDTLEYLKRGGRLSKSVAAIGELLSIKPLITIEGGEIKVIGKARGTKRGNDLLVEHIEKAGGIDFNRPFELGYTGLSDDLLQKFISDSGALWQTTEEDLPIYTIGGTIGTHAGPGAIAVAFFHD